jgi:kynurenine formamidase
VRHTLFIILSIIAALLTGCAAPPHIDPAKLVDLTYSFDENTVYWPNAEGFRHRKDAWAVGEAGFWYAAGEFTSAEHGGTHIDSPIHFAEAKQTLDQIPVAKLIAPAVVIDVSGKAAQDRDYRASRADIEVFEQQHGVIAPGTIVIFRTGWGKFYPDRKQYLGSDVKGDTANLHFPGIARDAAELLVQRNIAAAGIDTASLDHGPSTDFIVHQVLTKANIYGIENIAHAELLPATGATLIALPMKIAQGTGGPARVVALLP